MEKGTVVPVPLHPNQPAYDDLVKVGSRKIDIEVYWLGGHAVALRSLSLQDSIAHRMLTDTNARSSVINRLDRTLRDPIDSSFRSAVIGIYGKDEPNGAEVCGFGILDSLIRHNYQNPQGDSVPVLTSEIYRPIHPGHIQLFRGIAPHHSSLGHRPRKPEYPIGPMSGAVTIVNNHVMVVCGKDRRMKSWDGKFWQIAEANRC